MFYGIELDFGEPIKYFANLQLVFEELRRKGHISVCDADNPKYQAAAEGINPSKYTCYVETSTYEDGTFCKNLDLWVGNLMEHAFGDPTLRPYFEAYLERDEPEEEEEI